MPGFPDGLAKLILSSTDDITLLQIGGDQVVKRLVPPSGGIAIVKSAAAWAVKDRKDILHLPHRPYTAGNFPVYTKGMQQTGGVHCSHQIFEKRLAHMNIHPFCPEKTEQPAPHLLTQAGCGQVHQQGW